MTRQSVNVAFVAQGDTGEPPAADAKACGVELMVVKLAEAKKGFVLLPKRWVVERSFAWAACFRRPARDFERSSEILKGFHDLAFAVLMPHRFARFVAHLCESS